MPGAAPKAACEAVRFAIMEEHDRRVREGIPLAQAGTGFGHLNCYPGDQVAPLIRALDAAGVGVTVDGILGRPRKLLSIGCNINLPGSRYQNWHVDGDYDDEFVIVNVALEDIEVRNGSIELAPGSYARWMRYWQFLARRLHHAGVRCNMTQGDVLIRSSTLWHRGAPNRSDRLRPMLALIYNGQEVPATEFLVGYNGGKTKFMANRFEPGLAGRIKEFIQLHLPLIHAGIRLIKSFLAPVGRST